MRTLQDRMDGMKPYFRAIEMYNDALMVRVMLPSNWKIYPSQNGKIKVTPSEVNANEAVYYADSNEATYEDIFDLVEETIKSNQEIVLKLKLLREKVEELKEIFSTSTYDELSGLRFVLEKASKPKAKRKYTRKKKEAVEETEEKPDIAEKEEDNSVEVNKTSVE